MLVLLIDDDIRDVQKGIRAVKDARKEESLCLAEALKDRITTLEQIKDKLQNVE
jgi:uncharacterized protein